MTLCYALRAAGLDVWFDHRNLPDPMANFHIAMHFRSVQYPRIARLIEPLPISTVHSRTPPGAPRRLFLRPVPPLCGLVN